MPSKKKPATSALHSPEPITRAHDLNQFMCGEPSLDDWLRSRSLKNEDRGGSRTYVVCAGNAKRVVAYYCLAAGAVAHGGVSGRVRRNMPDPVPVIVIGRLAVDQTFQGSGIGRSLLRDAIMRSLQAANIAGVRAVLVHAISMEARQFYKRCGFHPSPVDPMTLMITIVEAERTLSD